MRLLIAFVIAMSPNLAGAAIVVANSSMLLVPITGMPGNPMPNYKLTLLQDPIDDSTEILLSITSISTSQFNLLFSSPSLDGGSDWYLVTPGEHFSRQGISDGSYTPIFQVENEPLGNTTSVVVGNDFYVGVNTGTITDNVPDERDAFGWIRFNASPSGFLGNPPETTLEIVDNVMSYYSPGIIVGTTTVVPEPAALATGGFALLALAALRRRK